MRITVWAVLLVLAAWPVGAVAVDLSYVERAYVRAHPVIRVSNEKSWLPFNFFADGKPQGYSVDYIQLVAEKVGLEVEFVTGPTWSEFLDRIRRRDLDVMLNIVNSEQRRAYINFTSAYIISTPGIFTRGARTDIRSLGDLVGRTVAVPKGFFSQDLLSRKYPGIRLYLTRNVVESMEAVLTGKADAIITDTGVAHYLINKHEFSGLNNSATISDPMFVNVMNLGVRKDRPILRDILQKGMDAVSDAEVSALRQKWLGPTEGAHLQSPLPLNEAEKAYLSARDEITMCIDPDWLPYEKFDARGRHIGMSADYFEAFALRIGKPIRAVPTETWSQSLDKARARACDVLSLAMETPERLEYLNFTKPYVKSPMVVATRPGASFIPDISSIGNRPVGIVRGYAYVSVFRAKYPEVPVVEVDTINAGLEQVRDGKLFGMVGTLTTIAYAIQTGYVGELKISGRFDDTLDLSIGVRKDSPELLGIFNKAIDALNPDQHRDIANKWVAMHYEEVPDYELLIQLAVVFVLIAGFLAYRQVQLRKYNAELERLSTTDRLTGLFNRLKLDEMLELRHGEFERFGHAFSVIMIDVDDFKMINDRFGHQVGDRVLVKIGETIKAHARSIDSVGRWGGEEFLVVCSETGVQGAMVQAENIRAAMRETDFAMGRALTVSLGVAEIKPGEAVKDMISRADAALYAAKEGGRDQAVKSA